MTTAAVEGPLSKNQIEQYRELGYLVLPSLFDTEEIAEMARESDRILSLCINASIATGEKDPRLDIMTCVDHPDLLDVRKLQPVKDLSDCFRRLTEDERLLGPMRQIMGCEPILMEEKLNYKQRVRCPEYQKAFNPPATPDQFLLHHDWGYFRQQGYPQDIISSAIAIDECTPENGPLRMIPGTHKKEWPMVHDDPSSGIGLVKEEGFSESDRVEILCPPGSVMIFHSMILHDSVQNGTLGPRRLMIYSHYPGSFHFPEDDRNKRNRTLGSEIENRYRQMKSSGSYSDAPVTRP